MEDKRINLEEAPQSTETTEVKEIKVAEELEVKETETFKQIGPIRLVLRRFFRSKLSIVGLCMIIFLFVFSFLGPVFSSWGESEPDRPETPIQLENETIVYTHDIDGLEVEVIEIIITEKLY